MITIITENDPLIMSGEAGKETRTMVEILRLAVFGQGVFL